MSKHHRIHRISALRTDDAGLSMAEIVVALMVFAVLATSVAYGLNGLLSLTQHSRARESAVAIATEDLDSMRALAYTNDDGILDITSTDDPIVKTVGGTRFSLDRNAFWGDTKGNLGACGTGDGTLAYKSVIDTVSWQLAGGGTKQSISMTTSVAPTGNLNTDTTGTIIVGITGSQAGAAMPGIAIAITPVSGGAKALSTPPDPTDNDGCSFGRKVAPGTYTVTASVAGGIGIDQAPTAVNTSVVVKAGQNAPVNLAYDLAATYPLTFPAEIGSDMAVTFINSTRTSTFPNIASKPNVTAFPWSDGYRVVAGSFSSSTNGGASTCLAPDPAAWVTPAGSDRAIGRAGPATSAGPGETALPTVVPMGVVKLTALPVGYYVTAVANKTGPDGDPGCQAQTVIRFPAGASARAIALPYGTWTVYTGPSYGSTAFRVSSAFTSVVGRGSVSSSSVTLDPRTVA